MTDFRIYFEPQQAGLCAVHAINTLLQGAYFTAVDLAQIARALDEQEAQLMREAGEDAYVKFLAEESSNVAEDGNFSVGVIRKALENFGVRLVRTSTEEGRALFAKATEQIAFIANLEAHWLTQRNFAGQWMNCNSLLKRPDPLSDFYLESYLSSLISQGYDLFVVVGDLPLANPNFVSSAGRWFDIEPQAAGKQPKVTLVGAETIESQATQNIGASIEEDELQKAIAASLMENNNVIDC